MVQTTFQTCIYPSTFTAAPTTSTLVGTTSQGSTVGGSTSTQTVEKKNITLAEIPRVEKSLNKTVL